MEVVLRTPSRADRFLIRRMVELYLYDFSEFDGGDLDEHGSFGYGDLDYFWFEETHAAFLVTVDGKLAGFVLIDCEVILEGNDRSITEFFIMRKYRRRHVGSQIAAEIFNRLPARWEVRVIRDNLPAQAFWRKALSAYAGDAVHEVAVDNDAWEGVVFSFDNRQRAPA